MRAPEYGVKDIGADLPDFSDKFPRKKTEETSKRRPSAGNCPDDGDTA